MNSQGKTPALTFTGAMVLLATLAAGLTFGGNCGYELWLEHRKAVPYWQGAPQSLGTFVAPVGGAALDGVYRASADNRDWSPYPLATLSGCEEVLPNAGISAASTWRISSKL
jgi:hypothetical protein